MRCWDLVAVGVGGEIGILQQTHFNAMMMSSCGSFPPTGLDPGWQRRHAVVATFRVLAVSHCGSGRRNGTCVHRLFCGPSVCPLVPPISVGSLVSSPEMFCRQLRTASADRRFGWCRVSCRFLLGCWVVVCVSFLHHLVFGCWRVLFFLSCHCFKVIEVLHHLAVSVFLRFRARIGHLAHF